MISVELPQLAKNSEDFYDSVVVTTRPLDKRARLQNASESVAGVVMNYRQLATKRGLAEISATPETFGGAEKEDFDSLYTSFLSSTNAVGRAHYDTLLLAPEQQICPYCGTQQANTIDHYLPQSLFAHLSIAFENLVASCSSCNHLKTNYVPTNPDDLLFHPYYEAFPISPWLVAEVDRALPVTVVYSVADDATEHARVSRQFEELKLAKNFAFCASNEIRNRTYEFQRLHQRGPTFLRESLLEAAHSAARFKWYPWKPVLYNVLAADDWFCNGGFIEPSEEDEA